VRGPVAAERMGAQYSDINLASLGDWTGRLFDFHWCIERVPKALTQQDARQYASQGLVGGMDGITNDHMGAGRAVGIDKQHLIPH
jgi:hypothetical protein